VDNESIVGSVTRSECEVRRKKVFVSARSIMWCAPQGRHSEKEGTCVNLADLAGTDDLPKVAVANSVYAVVRAVTRLKILAKLGLAAITS
jgi:hypothetical protein